MIHPDDILRPLLTACDQAAVENVAAGKGGPFAASLHVYDSVKGEMIDVAGPVCNAVLETGLASAHAEDRVLTVDNVAALRDILVRVGIDAASVYVVSTAESCPVCHAKVEILARQLTHGGLLRPERFTLVYGATYEETRDIAGFNDMPYHDDFQRPPGTGLVRQSHMKLHDIPEMVRERMMAPMMPIAVIPAKNRPVVGGGDVPEASVIQMASMMQKKVGIESPWNLREATLYTFTTDIGPLAYGECQWANVTSWVSVDHVQGKLFATQEAPDISNKDLFKIIRNRPHDPDHPAAALRFYHLTPFENLAQKVWRASDLPGYNGAGSKKS